MKENAREVLVERARALAARSGEVVIQTSLVLFARGGELYGLRTGEVTGSGRLRSLSPAPGAPPWLAGVILHQGEILSLIDLPPFWNVDPRGVVDLRTFVVLTNGVRRVGVLIEELLGLREVDQAPIEYQGTERAGLADITRHEGQPVFVLSAGSLFEDHRLKG